MRLAIVTATVFSLTAGMSFAQSDIQPQPGDPGATQHPPIHSEPTTPPTNAAPQIPDASAARTPDASQMLTEDQAKSKIEAEGYTEVSGLKKDEKGMWTATAMKDGKPVQLSLNDQGNVAVLN